MHVLASRPVVALIYIWRQAARMIVPLERSGGRGSSGSVENVYSTRRSMLSITVKNTVDQPSVEASFFCVDGTFVCQTSEVQIFRNPPSKLARQSDSQRSSNNDLGSIVIAPETTAILQC